MTIFLGLLEIARVLSLWGRPGLTTPGSDRLL
jgi:hypothetical protein